MLGHIETRMTSPIDEGDAGIVFKPDGTFRLFNTHTDMAEGKPLTAVQLEQGRKLQAFSLALQVPAVMDFLYGLAEDPEVVEVMDRGTVN